MALDLKGDKKGDRAIKDKISAFICKAKHNYVMIPFRASLHHFELKGALYSIV